ncbi:MAG TPA: PAS domain S-box protein [Methanospirillum sp.]|nr:PAS domain S-box protein [Methanospirillum sp.]
MTSHEPENLFPGFEDVPYEIFIVNAPIGIFVADENGRYTFINDAACAMTGYEKDELIGKNLSQFIFPEDRERAKEQFQKVRETGAAVGEFRYITKSGEVRYWEVKAVKVSDSCHIGYKSDITEKKLAEAELIMKNDELQGTFETLLSTEEELRQQLEEILAAQEEIKERERQLKETNSFLENLINRANVPIIVWDPSFKILRVNHAFEHLVGSSADDIVGKVWMYFLHRLSQKGRHDLFLPPLKESTGKLQKSLSFTNQVRLKRFYGTQQPSLTNPVMFPWQPLHKEGT